MALGAPTGLDLSPSFIIEVNGQGVDEALSSLITSLEYDSIDGAADMLKMQLNNPEIILTDKKTFMPGNTIRVWGGFGNQFTLIGGAIIEKRRPTFPGSGTPPTMEVVGYTADKRMAANSPAPDDDTKPFVDSKPEALKKAEREYKRRIKDINESFGEPGIDATLDAQRQLQLDQAKLDFKKQRRGILGPKKKKNPGGYEKKAKAGRAWPPGVSYADIAREKAEQYGFAADVDDTLSAVNASGAMQKSGVDDFKFLSMIANDNGFLFWVDASETGWTLHLKDPDNAADIQDFELDLKYNSGDQTTLLSFEGEELLGNGPTDVQAQIWNPKEKKLETYTIKVDPESESLEYSGDPTEPVYLPANSEAEIVIAFGGTAVKVMTDRQFQSPADLKRWLDNWAREQSSNFITGRGEVMGPGVEKLTARQVHTISGLPAPYSGRYYFTNVVHKIGAEGYRVEFSGRRVPDYSTKDS